ncbi:MAG TPA: adenosylcobinamide-GDP ribazoletransferase [Dehalococcoidia bacterium]|nr:adenosylcobinamide-GDP ribazoletransferase [Dehalococcoidia bacterium]
MTSFLDAIEFLTCVRLRRTQAADMRRVAASQAWFPLVGLLLGAALLGFDRLAQRALPEASVDVLLVVLLAVLTGALHLDGLADAADGLLGGGDRQRRLEIMRDVHAGTYAVVAIAAVVAMKWAGLAALPPGVRFEALLLVPCLARWSMLVTSAAFPYARPDGMGAAFHERAWPVATIAGTATALAASVALLGVGGVLALAFAAGCALAAGVVAKRAVGGMTGDLYGATIEISEALLLLCIAALANRGWIGAWLLR